jgi:hypothetical protein
MKKKNRLFWEGGIKPESERVRKNRMFQLSTELIRERRGGMVARNLVSVP